MNGLRSMWNSKTIGGGGGGGRCFVSVVSLHSDRDARRAIQCKMHF